MVGCFNKFLAQNMAQNKATLSAIELMKKAKIEGDTSYNWLLTYASTDLIALFRAFITELIPGVCSSTPHTQKHSHMRVCARPRTLHNNILTIYQKKRHLDAPYHVLVCMRIRTSTLILIS